MSQDFATSPEHFWMPFTANRQFKASPRLLEVPCATIEQMRLVNTLCRAYEWSLGLDPAQARRRAALPDPPRGEALANAG